ncbi:hypothetical protein JTE90_010490 [Oedothorax gibbosus]|uniref:Integrase catalytic domain-containing protein n=1 Tax=Oedothorax gibbosus TaxID=931172 RepID=A0AAV6W056_9ARAC|nr:hypothetical protein JTE90_010490 [Oedothorax gibbosus]
MVRGLTFRNNNDYLKGCKISIQNKQNATPYLKKSKFVSKEILDLVHSDPCGPMKIPSLGGSRYFVTFINDKSRHTEIFFLKNKNEAKDAFLKYKACIQNRTGKKIKVLRTDIGLEYVGQDFDKVLTQEGIRREKTAPYSPQQNRVSERWNQIFVPECQMYYSIKRSRKQDPKAYRFFDPNTQKVFVSRDAKFIDEINQTFGDDQKDQQRYDFPSEHPADPATATHGEINPRTETSPTDHQPEMSSSPASAMTSPQEKRTSRKKRPKLHSEGLPGDLEKKRCHAWTTEEAVPLRQVGNRQQRCVYIAEQERSRVYIAELQRSRGK